MPVRVTLLKSFYIFYFLFYFFLLYVFLPAVREDRGFFMFTKKSQPKSADSKN